MTKRSGGDSSAVIELSSVTIYHSFFLITNSNFTENSLKNMSLKRRCASSRASQTHSHILIFLLSCILPTMSSRASVSAFDCLHRATFSFTRAHRHYRHGYIIRLFSHEALKESSSHKEHLANGFYAPENSFEAIGIQSPILIQRIHDYFSSITTSLATPRPSAVQAASFKTVQCGEDVTIGAETGSGKTLAYLLPLVDDILQKKVQSSFDEKENDLSLETNQGKIDYTYARAMILVPNKELANQVLRMAIPLCGGPTSVVWNGGASGGNVNDSDEDDTTNNSPSSADIISTPSHIVRLGILPGNLNTPEDYKPFRMAVQDPVDHPPLDIIITTPASLDRWGLNPKFIDFFADIQTLVIDEADMLFDGGYIRSLDNVLLGFKRADRLDSSYGVSRTQYILVAATIPDMGLKSVHAYILKRFPRANRVTMKGMHNARHYGLQYKTLWMEDDASLVEDNVKRRRMEKLVALLKQPPSEELEGNPTGIESETTQGQGLKDEKVMVFLNSVEDVDAVTKALIRANIPAVPYHAKIPLADRARYLDRFRKYTKEKSVQASTSGGSKSESSVPVMVCTDLASRGLDVPGVTAVVQLQFAGNVVAHLHRMGRCGRAGNRNGRGIIFYGRQERELVSVIQEAERQQDRMVLQGDVSEFELSDDEVGDDVAADVGKVDEAFSRKRGFTKKRKKLEKNVSE